MLPQNLNAGSSVASLKSRNAKFSVTRCLYEKAGLDPIVVQTHRSILASMSDFRQSIQGSAPEPEDVARVKTVLLSMTLRASELPFVQPSSRGPSSGYAAKPATVSRR
jgi:hypothetical protein